jgi:integrase
VFANWDGQPRSPSRVSQDFAEATEKLKIDVTLHGLRRTHVSQLNRLGTRRAHNQPPDRHASAAITLEVYGHLFSNTDERAAEIMQAAFARLDGSQTE